MPRPKLPEAEKRVTTSVVLLPSEVAYLKRNYGSVVRGVRSLIEAAMQSEETPRPAKKKLLTKCDRCTRLNLDNPHCPACGTHK